MSPPSRRGDFGEVLRLLHGGACGVYSAAALSCGRGGELLCASAGDADTATVFDLASLTKALCTSILCMRLVDARRLALDEAVLPGVSVLSRALAAGFTLASASISRSASSIRSIQSLRCWL